MLKYKRKMILGLFIIASIGMVACSARNSGKNTSEQKDSAQSENVSGAAVKIKCDAQMLAVVKSVDMQAGIVILQETQTGENYTLTYTGSTQIFDKYNSAMSMAQVLPGDLVQAYYYKKKVQLTGLCYRNDTWEYRETKDWKIDMNKSEIIVGDTRYYYEGNVSLISSGSAIEFMELNKQDVLSVFGIDRQVLSVRVERGHGFIRPTGIQEFIGGWIEVGKIIKPITEGMLLVAPEGNYDVKVVKDGFGGVLSAHVERDRETNVDFTDLGEKSIRYGTVEFTITPEDAKLYIAGEETDYSTQVILQHDTYRISAKADGYETYTGDLKVNQNLAHIEIDLKKSGTTEATPKPTPKPTQKATAAPTAIVGVPIVSFAPLPTINPDVTSGTYKINVTGTEGASVYFDDAYVGTIPVSFAKTSGTHTLTLSKTGYQTKSYTIEVGNADTDVTFSLPELIAE